MSILRSGNVEIPKDLPANDGVIFFLWKPGESQPSLQWKGPGAEGGLTVEHFGRALEILIAYLLTTDMTNLKIIQDVVMHMIHQVRDQPGSQTVN